MSLHIAHAEHVHLQIELGALQALNSAETHDVRSFIAGLAEPPAARRPLSDAAEGLAPPKPGELWPGQGGIYVTTIPAMLGLPARHLVVGTEEARLAYGGYGHETPGAASQADGLANTKALLADPEEHPAAQWCADYRADGHADFHLGSRFDWLMAYLTAPQCFDKEGWYLTSTQYSRTCAFVQDFAYGDSDCLVKDYEFRVRPFRWIHLST